MFPVECVARGYLTGSGLVEYHATGAVCGVAAARRAWSTARELPDADLHPGHQGRGRRARRERLLRRGRPPVGADAAAQLRQATLAVYSRGRDIARDRGIILADTKFEFGFDARRTAGPRRRGPHPGLLPLLAGRPVGAGPRAAVVRQAVRPRLADLAGLRLGPRVGEQPPPLPDEVVERTRAKYVEAYERLTGRTLS